MSKNYKRLYISKKHLYFLFLVKILNVNNYFNDNELIINNFFFFFFFDLSKNIIYIRNIKIN